MSRKPIIVILGPTATGKSALAVTIAKKFNGEVISADSRQVYKRLDIGSGKITKQEMHGIKHHLLDVADPQRIFSVAQYSTLGKRALHIIWKRNKLPIVCGGTGFYIDSLIYNQTFPSVKPNMKLRLKLEKKTPYELLEMLKRKDPERAKNIDQYNKRRLIRALEIIASQGKVPEIMRKPIDANVLILGIQKEKNELRKAIYERLIRRMRSGLVREVQKLHGSGVSWTRLESLGLEYRYVAEFLQSKIKSKEELITMLSRKIYQYAKRQMTWFKRNKNIVWIHDAKRAETHVKNFLRIL